MQKELLIIADSRADRVDPVAFSQANSCKNFAKFAKLILDSKLALKAAPDGRQAGRSSMVAVQ